MGKAFLATVSVCLCVSAYIAILFSGDNAPPGSWKVSAAGFFGQEIIVVITAVLTVALSLFWIVKRPLKITLFDLWIIIIPTSLWGLLLLVHLV